MKEISFITFCAAIPNEASFFNQVLEKGMSILMVKNNITINTIKDMETIQKGSKLRRNKIAVRINNASITFHLLQTKVDNLKEFIIKKCTGQIKYKKFYALKNINLIIEKGEKIGIIGHNGAGKSTLLKLISGVIKPTKGTILVRGNVAPLLELGAGFDYECTGQENIYLNAAILGQKESFIKEHLESIIEFSGLRDFIHEPVKNYSSGMRARLGFAIATQVNADILILDEILGVGDELFKKKSSQKMQEMIESDNTVIIVSHNLQQIQELTNKVIWLERGMIKKIGPSADICKAYREYMN